jgi:hypothetical protein
MFEHGVAAKGNFEDSKEVLKINVFKKKKKGQLLEERVD